MDSIRPRPARSSRRGKLEKRGERVSEIVYEGRVRIERVRGPLRLAHVPSEPEPVAFGVHGAIAEHYGVSPEVSAPHATTIDYLIAAAGG
jgi:hypothetical protein